LGKSSQRRGGFPVKAKVARFEDKAPPEGRACTRGRMVGCMCLMQKINILLSLKPWEGSSKIQNRVPKNNFSYMMEAI